MALDAVSAPEASVLIARVSLQDPTRFEQTLQALQAQRCAFAFEIVVVDRVGDVALAAAGRDGVTMQCRQVGRDSTLPSVTCTAQRMPAHGLHARLPKWWARRVSSSVIRLNRPVCWVLACALRRGTAFGCAGLV